MKIARIEIEDPFRNKHFLNVFDKQGAVKLRMSNIHRTPLALSNLQARGKAPAFWDPKDPNATLDRIVEWADSGVGKVVDVEKHPSLAEA